MLVRLHTRLPRVREAAAGEPAVQIHVRVERRGGMSHGTITLVAGGERAQRAASSVSCDRVLAGLAVMAAIGLEGGDVPSPPVPESRPAVPEPSPPVPEPRPPIPEEEALGAPPTSSTHGRETGHRQDDRSPSAPRPRYGVGFGTSVEVSANRSAVVTPRVFAQLTIPSSLAPFLRLGVGRSFRSNTVSAWGTVGIQWSEATLLACADILRQEKLGLAPCLNADAARLEAVVIEPLPSRTRSALWLSAGSSVRLAWRPLPAVSFELFGGARIPLIRNQLLFEPATLVYEAPLIVPFLGAGVVAHVR